MNDIIEGVKLGRKIYKLITLIIFAVCAIGGGIYKSYIISSEDSPWLFIAATAVFLGVLIICASRLLSHKMKFVDFLGNIFVTGLISYFGIVLFTVIVMN